MGVKAWTCKDSAELYNVSGWGQGSFEINDEGHVVVAPFGSDGGKIDLKNVVDDLVRRGLSPPLLLRFSDILKKRLDEICNHHRLGLRRTLSPRHADQGESAPTGGRGAHRVR
jgi:arginine decarboxylase